MRVVVCIADSDVEACLAITPKKKHGRTYFMGTALLRDVTLTPEGVEGTLVEEMVEQYEMTPAVMANLVKVRVKSGRFITKAKVDVTGNTAKVGYFCGPDFYVSRDGI